MKGKIITIYEAIGERGVGKVTFPVGFYRTEKEAKQEAGKKSDFYHNASTNKMDAVELEDGRIFLLAARNPVIIWDGNEPPPSRKEGVALLSLDNELLLIPSYPISPIKLEEASEK